MGCHGNHACLHSQNQNHFGEHFFRIQWVRLNKLVPIKKGPVGCKGGQNRPRGIHY